jgi:uncharacterized protein
MFKQSRRRSLHYVIKISKFCNLRCTYCYEYAELGIKHRMSLAQCEAMFTHAAEFADTNKLEYLNFIWHGGEPLLVPIEFYEAIGELQRSIFGDRIPFLNVVQTNLTVLTDRHLDLFRSRRFFTDFGVSFDVYGDQRVDLKGRQSNQTVLENIVRLMEAEISFGAIAVLARNTLPHARAIYRFFDTLGIECRFLPFYVNASDDQIDAHALALHEITAAVDGIFDEWLVSERATTVFPIQDHIEAAVAVMEEIKRPSFDKYADEIVFLVNTDGSTYGVADGYAADYRYGNAFLQPMEQILSSPGRVRAAEEADARFERYCGECPYVGFCPSHYVVDATPQQRALLAQSGCLVRNAITHIVERVQAAGLQSLFKERAGAAKPGNMTIASAAL